MARQPQSSDCGFPPQAVLVATGIVALAVITADAVGPWGSAFLIELAAAAFGTAIGFETKYAWVFSFAAALIAVPVAIIVFELVAGKGC